MFAISAGLENITSRDASISIRSVCCEGQARVHVRDNGGTTVWSCVQRMYVRLISVNPYRRIRPPQAAIVPGVAASIRLIGIA